MCRIRKLGTTGVPSILMKSDRWKKIEWIYHAALERKADERAAFLDETCHDAQLRREVESLLGYETKAEGFIEEPALDVVAEGMGRHSAQPMIGRRVGVYEITSLIGKGGMGEVYQARDTRLDRDVAIKTLPAVFSSDPQLLARFEREAKILASLNHPNIAVVHGLEESDGDRFLIQELIDGATLADRLRRGSIPVEEAFRFAIQIAEALEASHAKGIVHRDLKPANIQITSENRVKVLDFGLAKAIHTKEGAALSTLTADPERKLLGTPAYMSPEQARGREVDRRTDVWAFGCVLFEMLAGRMAFRGETLSDTIVQVLEHEPDLEALPASTTPKIQDLLRKCLRKDINRRLRDIGDARLEIADSMTAAAPPEQRDVNVPASRHVLIAIGFLGLAAVALLVALSLEFFEAEGPPRLEGIRRLTSLPGNETQPVWSPDTQFVAFVSAMSGNRDIWIKPVSSGDPIRVTQHPADDYDPDWSPDGKTIVFHSDRPNGGLYTIPAFRGQARRIVDFGYRPRWSPDGQRILFQSRQGGAVTNEVYAVTYPFDAPPQKLLAYEEGGEAYLLADWSPDGRHLAYNHLNSGGPGLAISSLDDTGALWFLEHNGPRITGSAPVWTSDGKGIVFARGGSLLHVPLDDRYRVASEPSRLTTGPGDSSPRLSRDGKRLAYTIASGRYDIWKVELDPDSGQLTGDAIPVVTNPSNDMFPALLPDNRHLLFVSDRANAGHLYVSDLDGLDVRLVDDSREWRRALSVSPDSRWIALLNAELETYLLPFDPVTLQALGPAQSLGLVQTIAGNWSPDGKYLLYTGSDVLTTGGIDALDLTADQPRKVFWPFEPEFVDQYPTKSHQYFSPDGQWIVFGASKDRSNPSIFVVKPGSNDPQFIWQGAAFSRWDPAMRRIYMWSERPDETQGKLGFVAFDAVTGQPLSDFQLVDLKPDPRPGSSTAFSVSRDGRWLFFYSEAVEGDIYVGDLVPSN